MNKEITLVIMAAGMGSRFGGLKQIEPVGKNNEFIIDYSVYDAIQAGFTKIVFIIKEENYEIFKETIGKRVEPHIKTEYVFQTNEILPLEYQERLKERKKPLGTAHAILCAKEKIKEPFAIINADDFYGRDAYVKAATYLKGMEQEEYGVVAYRIGNTLTPNGAAKRGVCKVTNENKLIELVESSVLEQEDLIEVSPLDGSEPFKVEKNTMDEFLTKNKDDLEQCEFLIPIVLNEYVKEKSGMVSVIETTANWYGITYKEDKELVVKALAKMTEEGIYPNELWKHKEKIK